MARESAPGSPSRSASRSAKAAASATYSWATEPPTAGPAATRPAGVTAYRAAGRPRPPAGGRCSSVTNPASTSTRRWWRVVLGCPPTAATRSATVGAADAGRRAMTCSSRRREGSVTSTGGSSGNGVGVGPSGAIFFTTPL